MLLYSEQINSIEKYRLSYINNFKLANLKNYIFWFDRQLSILNKLDATNSAEYDRVQKRNKELLENANKQNKDMIIIPSDEPAVSGELPGARNLFYTVNDFKNLIRNTTKNEATRKINLDLKRIGLFLALKESIYSRKLIEKLSHPIRTCQELYFIANTKKALPKTFYKLSPAQGKTLLNCTGSLLKINCISESGDIKYN